MDATVWKLPQMMPFLKRFFREMPGSPEPEQKKSNPLDPFSRLTSYIV